jgi:aminoglycoside phosphotransferase family enzyme
METHISSVLISEEYVYKIKISNQYSFLDFSTVAKRKCYCQREIELNKRLTENIYIDVLPVKEISGNCVIDALSEVAFLCMHLNSFNRYDLSKLFLNRYNNLFPAWLLKVCQLLDVKHFYLQ